MLLCQTGLVPRTALPFLDNGGVDFLGHIERIYMVAYGNFTILRRIRGYCRGPEPIFLSPRGRRFSTHSQLLHLRERCMVRSYATANPGRFHGLGCILSAGKLKLYTQQFMNQTLYTVEQGSLVDPIRLKGPFNPASMMGLMALFIACTRDGIPDCIRVLSADRSSKPSGPKMEKSTSSQACSGDSSRL
jgi:hypothetical protein